jgi:hypothetical protein
MDGYSAAAVQPFTPAFLDPLVCLGILICPYLMEARNVPEFVGGSEESGCLVSSMKCLAVSQSDAPSRDRGHLPTPTSRIKVSAAGGQPWQPGSIGSDDRRVGVSVGYLLNDGPTGAVDLRMQRLRGRSELRSFG